MCVETCSSNGAVLGDCGKSPLWIEAAKRCIKYWIKIPILPNYKYVKLSYNMLKSLDEYDQTYWAISVKCMLLSNGFGYVWNNQHVLNPKLVLHVTEEKVKVSIFNSVHP